MNDTQPLDWGVIVNECGIFATANPAADWWMRFLASADRCGRATELKLGPCGGLWHIARSSKDDAEGARQMFLGRGIHRTHAKVQRLSAYRRNQARKATAE